jgi:hypothetical protein
LQAQAGGDSPSVCLPTFLDASSSLERQRRSCNNHRGIFAAIEDYHAEPMPFIADDLFVNFDDKRSAAGFQVLNELAKKTQVLFFTHHQHLLDVAHRALGTSVATVTLPAAAEPAPVHSEAA